MGPGWGGNVPGYEAPSLPPPPPPAAGPKQEVTVHEKIVSKSLGSSSNGGTGTIVGRIKTKAVECHLGTLRYASALGRAKGTLRIFGKSIEGARLDLFAEGRNGKWDVNSAGEASNMMQGLSAHGHLLGRIGGITVVNPQYSASTGFELYKALNVIDAEYTYYIAGYIPVTVDVEAGGKIVYQVSPVLSVGADGPIIGLAGQMRVGGYGSAEAGIGWSFASAGVGASMSFFHLVPTVNFDVRPNVWNGGLFGSSTTQASANNPLLGAWGDVDEDPPKLEVNASLEVYFYPLTLKIFLYAELDMPWPFKDVYKTLTVFHYSTGYFHKVYDLL